MIIMIQTTKMSKSECSSEQKIIR
jgi:hypothetical protein